MNKLFYIDEVNGCWLWKKGKFSDGYAAVYCDGKMRRAHRLFYERYV